ncbi:MAG: leucine-rich repeat domain-containing protein [Promethearchaeota archaeon]
MTRKVDDEKYKRILKRLAKGETQSSIVIGEKCSYGTISAAKHWEKTWKSTTISTENDSKKNMTKIIVAMPNFWLDRLNEDILTGVWKDYSDAVLDIIRTYFRTRYKEFDPESRRPLNTRSNILNEIHEVSKAPNKNLHDLFEKGHEDLQKHSDERSRETYEEGQRISSMFKKTQTSDDVIFRNYHGKPLIQEEFDVLMEIEQQIGEIPRWEYEIPKSSSQISTITAFPLNEQQELLKFSYVLLGNHIVGLKLASKGLTTLPKIINQLKFLQHLNLRNNSLTELPKTIGELAYLDELILNGNALTSIPESIGNLKNLEILQLDDNKLTGIPKILGTMRCDLGLANNKISSVDKKILNKSNVDLTGNPIWDVKKDNNL